MDIIRKSNNAVVGKDFSVMPIEMACDVIGIDSAGHYVRYTDDENRMIIQSAIARDLADGDKTAALNRMIAWNSNFMLAFAEMMLDFVGMAAQSTDPNIKKLAEPFSPLLAELKTMREAKQIVSVTSVQNRTPADAVKTGLQRITRIAAIVAENSQPTL